MILAFTSLKRRLRWQAPIHASSANLERSRTKVVDGFSAGTRLFCVWLACPGARNLVALALVMLTALGLLTICDMQLLTRKNALGASNPIVPCLAARCYYLHCLHSRHLLCCPNSALQSVPQWQTRYCISKYDVHLIRLAESTKSFVLLNA